MELEAYREELKTHILDTLAYCINCRFCLPSCPRFDITGGDITHGASGITRALYYAVKWDMRDRATLKELRDILYACMTCKNCELACKKLSTGTKLLEAIENGRRLLLEDMIGPMPRQQKALESLNAYGNPHGMPRAKRNKWMTSWGVPCFSEVSEPEFLLYLGCTAPVDEAVQPMVEAVIALFRGAEISFGIWEDEVCCGNPALKMGETLLFEDLSKSNLEQFESLGVRHIVALSPHCFDTFLNRYPSDAMNGMVVQHYSQVLAELLDQKKLVPQLTSEKRVCYQDPCYLGRHNEVYDAPRAVLERIPGVEFIEFAGTRSDSLCCGGGGGRMWSDFDSEVERIANVRIRQALELGVDTIVTACPWCLINMIDAIKSVNAEDRIDVKDLGQLLLEALPKVSKTNLLAASTNSFGRSSKDSPAA